MGLQIESPSYWQSMVHSISLITIIRLKSQRCELQCSHIFGFSIFVSNDVLLWLVKLMTRLFFKCGQGMHRHLLSYNCIRYSYMFTSAKDLLKHTQTHTDTRTRSRAHTEKGWGQQQQIRIIRLHTDQHFLDPTLRPQTSRYNTVGWPCSGRELNPGFQRDGPTIEI